MDETSIRKSRASLMTREAQWCGVASYWWREDVDEAVEVPRVARQGNRLPYAVTDEEIVAIDTSLRDRGYYADLDQPSCTPRKLAERRPQNSDARRASMAPHTPRPDAASNALLKAPSSRLFEAVHPRSSMDMIGHHIGHHVEEEPQAVRSF